MKQMLRWAAAVLLLPLASLSLAGTEVPRLTDLAADLAEARRQGVPLVVVFEAPGCVYCQRLKEEVLRPMVISGEYDGQLLLRRLDITSSEPVRDASGRTVPARELAARFRVALTPTTILLGPGGERLGAPLFGYNGEFWVWYFEKAVARARTEIRARLAASCTEGRTGYC